MQKKETGDESIHANIGRRMGDISTGMRSRRFQVVGMDAVGSVVGVRNSRPVGVVVETSQVQRPEGVQAPDSKIGGVIFHISALIL
jgi:hypothetical protein